MGELQLVEGRGPAANFWRPVPRRQRGGRAELVGDLPDHAGSAAHVSRPRPRAGAWARLDRRGWSVQQRATRRNGELAEFGGAGGAVRAGGSRSRGLRARPRRSFVLYRCLVRRRSEAEREPQSSPAGRSVQRGRSPQRDQLRRPVLGHRHWRTPQRRASDPVRVLMADLLSKDRIIAPPGFNRWLVPPAARDSSVDPDPYGFSVFGRRGSPEGLRYVCSSPVLDKLPPEPSLDAEMAVRDVVIERRSDA